MTRDRPHEVQSLPHEPNTHATPHSSAAEGVAGPCAGPQARSFRAFMDSLYENPANEGYAYWHLPGLKHLERMLEF